MNELDKLAYELREFYESKKFELSNGPYVDSDGMLRNLETAIHYFMVYIPKAKKSVSKGYSAKSLTIATFRNEVNFIKKKFDKIPH